MFAYLPFLWSTAFSSLAVVVADVVMVHALAAAVVMFDAVVVVVFVAVVAVDLKNV